MPIEHKDRWYLSQGDTPHKRNHLLKLFRLKAKVWTLTAWKLNPLPAEAGRFLLRLKARFRLKPVAMRLKPAEATAHRRLC